MAGRYSLSHGDRLLTQIGEKSSLSICLRFHEAAKEQRKSIMQRKCWAAPLGKCSPKLSREHIISAAFFDGNKITAAGFDWTREKVVEIPLSSAVAKVLCENHNNGLSDLDTAIKEIGERFKSVITMKSTSAAAGSIDGSKFERWLLKTTLNVICTSPKMYQNFWPDEYLAALVFGHIKFDYSTGMGLYAVHPKLYGNFTDAWNFVNVRPLILAIEGDMGLLGVLITFWGHRRLRSPRSSTPPGRGPPEAGRGIARPVSARPRPPGSRIVP